MNVDKAIQYDTTERPDLEIQVKWGQSMRVHTQ